MYHQTLKNQFDRCFKPDVIRKACIVLGSTCNFKCKHCNSREIAPKLTEKEKLLISSEINNYDIKRILFVGGETIFFIRDINQILSGIKNLNKREIKITTNGSFAITIPFAEKTLSSFIKLDGIQLSYDAFHEEFLPFENIKNLYKACIILKKDFSVILTISKPLDLTIVRRLNKIGKFPIGVQKVLPIGSAIKNQVYFNPLKFSRVVLRRKCPGRKEIVYICGRGFTTCCSNLVYNNVVKGITHKSIKQHVESEFYQIINRNSFGALLNKYQIEIPKNPLFSLECNLCQYIFKRISKDKLW